MYNSFFTAVASNQGLLICRERAGFSAGRAKSPHVLAPVFITIYSQVYYDGFVITYRNQADRPLYPLRNSPLMQRCAIERVT